MREGLLSYMQSKCDESFKANDDATLLKYVKACYLLQLCEVRFRWGDRFAKSKIKERIAEKYPEALKAIWNEIDTQSKADQVYSQKEFQFYDLADKFAAKHGEPIPNDEFDAALAELAKFWPPPKSDPTVAFDISQSLSHLASLTLARKRPDLHARVNALAAKWSAETNDPAYKRWLGETPQAHAQDTYFVAHMAMGDDGELVDLEEQDTQQAAKKAAANPNAPPPPDPYAHFSGELESDDPAIRFKATADLAQLLNTSSKTAVTAVCRRLGTEWGSKMVADRQYDAFLALSKKAIALRPGNTDANEALLFLRVKALQAKGARIEARAEAKALYNFAALKNFDAAAALALEALSATRPGATNLDELRAVKSGSPEYEQAFEKATLSSYADYESAGNLLLLLDRPKAAAKVFERAALLATAEQSTQALENVARARKARDFDPTPAREWLAKALATSPALPPATKKVLENGAF
jgi:hypothetical protein